MLIRKFHKGTGEMVWWVKVLDTKSDLSLSLRTLGLASDLYRRVCYTYINKYV